MECKARTLQQTAQRRPEGNPVSCSTPLLSVVCKTTGKSVLLTPEMPGWCLLPRAPPQTGRSEQVKVEKAAARTLAKEAQTSRDGEGQSAVQPGEKGFFFFF